MPKVNKKATKERDTQVNKLASRITNKPVDKIEPAAKKFVVGSLASGKIRDRKKKAGK